MRRPARSLAATAAVLALAAGCGGDDGGDAGGESAGRDEATAPDATEDGDDVTTPQAEQTAGEPVAMPSSSDDLARRPDVTLRGGGRPDTTQVEDVVVGDGAEAVEGAEVTVQYSGVLADGGEPFDASWDRGQPFTFPLGQGRVIQGWDEGVAGMRVGGRRVLYVPADEAYGSTARGGIPADSDLVFVVDLLEVREPVTKADEPEVELPDEAPDALVVDDLVEGDGPEVEAGSFVEVHYVGKALSTGEVFDSSYDRGQAFPVQVGVGQVIPGWDEGLLGMREGGRRRLVIPPDLAYGAAGAGGVIGPDETLVFVIDLVSVS